MASTPPIKPSFHGSAPQFQLRRCALPSTREVIAGTSCVFAAIRLFSSQTRIGTIGGWWALNTVNNDHNGHQRRAKSANNQQNTSQQSAQFAKIKPKISKMCRIDPSAKQTRHLRLLLLLFSLEAFSPREVTRRPEAGGTVLLVGGHRPDQLRLAPVHRREEGLEHRHVVAPDRLVDTAAATTTTRWFESGETVRRVPSDNRSRRALLGKRAPVPPNRLPQVKRTRREARGRAATTNAGFFRERNFFTTGKRCRNLSHRILRLSYLVSV